MICLAVSSRAHMEPIGDVNSKCCHVSVTDRVLCDPEWVWIFSPDMCVQTRHMATW